MTPIRDLEDSLAFLRISLLSGDFSFLPTLNSQLKLQVDNLTEVSLSIDEIQRVKRRAADIRKLLTAAQQGMILARNRLIEIEKIKNGGGFYQWGGEPHFLQLPAVRERRF